MKASSGVSPIWPELIFCPSCARPLATEKALSDRPATCGYCDKQFRLTYGVSAGHTEFVFNGKKWKRHRSERSVGIYFDTATFSQSGVDRWTNTATRPPLTWSAEKAFADRFPAAGSRLLCVWAAKGRATPELVLDPGKAVLYGSVGSLSPVSSAVLVGLVWLCLVGAGLHGTGAGWVLSIGAGGGSALLFGGLTLKSRRRAPKDEHAIVRHTQDALAEKLTHLEMRAKTEDALVSIRQKVADCSALKRDMTQEDAVLYTARTQRLTSTIQQLSRAIAAGQRLQDECDKLARRIDLHLRYLSLNDGLPNAIERAQLFTSDAHAVAAVRAEFEYLLHAIDEVDASLAVTTSSPTATTVTTANHSTVDPVTANSAPAATSEVPYKTLRCSECSRMNIPTEWYCEACGGELAAF